MIIANASSAPDPTLAQRQRQRRKRYKRSLNRPCYPLHFMREYTPPNLHDPQRAKGPLDRRSKRLSFPHFFLRRKKCGRRRPPPRQGETDSPPGRRNPPRAKGSLYRRSKRFSLVPFFLQKKKVTRAGGTKRPSLRPQAQRLFAAARAFPHITGVFLIVVVPPTVPAQLSAAAACYYGKNYSFCRVAG